MKAIFGHFGDHWWNFCHLVTIRLRVFALQHLPTATARFRLEVMALFDLLDWHQFPPRALVPWLPAALAPTLGPSAWLPRCLRTIAGGWL
jgi:hypothetical protein